MIDNTIIVGEIVFLYARRREKRRARDERKEAYKDIPLRYGYIKSGRDFAVIVDRLLSSFFLYIYIEK